MSYDDFADLEPLTKVAPLPIAVTQPVQPLNTSTVTMHELITRKIHSIGTPDIMAAIYARVTRLVRLGDADYEADEGEVVPLHQANIVTSEVPNPDHPFAEVMHRPAIDLDVPVYAVPSSTPGHSHLYIEQALTWDNYAKLLDVLTEIGLVEYGYQAASVHRKRTDLRLPWVPKSNKEN